MVTHTQIHRDYFFKKSLVVLPNNDYFKRVQASEAAKQSLYFRSKEPAPAVVLIFAHVS